MSNKNTSINDRFEVLKLLERRRRFIASKATFKSFERDIFTVQRKNLDNIKLVLKAIKKMNVVLTKKNFKEILEKLNQSYKITIYGNYSVHFNQSKKSTLPKRV